MTDQNKKNLIYLGVAIVALLIITQSGKTTDVTAELLPDVVKAPEPSKPASTGATTVSAKNLIAVRDTTVFEASDSTKVAKKVKSGEMIGKRIKSYMITSKGVKSLYYLVEWTSLFFLTNQGFVKAADTKEAKS